jgi:hypothetical protein
MRNLPVIILASVLILLVLVAGVWTRIYPHGQRSIRFGNDLVITTELPYPVAVLVSVQNPGGTTTPIAWAGLGVTTGTMTTTDATFPTSGTLVIEYASGMNVFPGTGEGVGPPPDIVAVYKAITGGKAVAGAVMITVDGLKDDFKGTTTVSVTPGSTPTVEITAAAAKLIRSMAPKQ